MWPHQSQYRQLARYRVFVFIFDESWETRPPAVFQSCRHFVGGGYRNSRPNFFEIFISFAPFTPAPAGIRVLLLVSSFHLHDYTLHYRMSSHNKIEFKWTPGGDRGLDRL